MQTFSCDICLAHEVVVTLNCAGRECVMSL